MSEFNENNNLSSEDRLLHELNLLIAEGFVEQLPNGNYKLTDEGRQTMEVQQKQIMKDLSS